MIERIARAAASRHHRWEGLSEDGRDTYRADAVAILQAMREPTEVMTEAGVGSWVRNSNCTLVQIVPANWTTMIAAALAPPPQI